MKPRPLFLVSESDNAAGRLSRLGPRALLDAELLDLIAGKKAESVLESGINLADELDPHLWVKAFGKDGLRLLALSEIVRRKRERAEAPQERLDAPVKVFERLQPLVVGLAVEKCWMFPLNRRNRPLCPSTAIEITSGTATASLMHPREVFRTAIKYSASAVIVAHNHPSGDPAPSHQDRLCTKQLVEAGRVVGIELLDHVIIGRKDTDPEGKGWYSFGEAGAI